MGFFSWRTCDTDESVAAPEANHPRARQMVYLLQPNGLPALTGIYDGYGGLSGETDIYAWLGRWNRHQLPSAIATNDAAPEQLGMLVEMGSYFEDQQTGKRWYCGFHPISNVAPDGYHSFGRFDEPVDGIGETPIQMMESGRWVERNFVEEPEYPIKLSFDPLARYEDQPASPICPDQGFFF